MKIKLSVVAAGIVVAIWSGGAALAQTSTSGGLRGVLKDRKTGELAVGATVVATSPALAGEQVVLTDENGQYFISSLPPGLYTLTIYYGKQPLTRSNVLIQVGKDVVVNVPVDSDAGEIIDLKGEAPIVDQGSTKTGVTITDKYTQYVPTGRTFGAVLNSASGAQNDTYGVSFAGATSVESIYVIEGINTTDTGFGGISSNLPNEFVSETEIITGGYNAEFGRATGGIVNVVTKQGSNQFHGSIFGNVQPGALISDAKLIQRQGNSIDSKTDLDYTWDTGAELGGPILKDKLWFHVGFNPSTRKQTVTRRVQSNVDDDGNGVADVDPETGFPIRTPIAESEASTQTTTYFYTAKVNGALSQNHQFQISAFGNPRTGDLPMGVVRDPAYRKVDTYDGAYDVAAKWTSKFNDGKTQLDAVLGFHRQINNVTPIDGQNLPIAQYRFTRSLYDFADLEGSQTIARCADGGADDPYPMIRNCPVVNYTAQGVGFLERRTNDRGSAVLALTQRVKAAGYHIFKAGIDAEFAGYVAQRGFSGGSQLRRFANLANGASGQWELQQQVGAKRPLTAEELMAGVDLQPGELLCLNETAVCEVLPEGQHATTSNRNVAAFVQDSWQIRPNLTINAGLRWEQQTGYVADELQGDRTPLGETIPKVAYELKNELAPRVGFIFDPSQEGKSKIFGHWGRFYESVPMDINVRAFGGDTTAFTLLNANRRAPEANGYDPNCDINHRAGSGDLSNALLQCSDRASLGFVGEGIAFVSPGLKGQFTDELIVGGEYQILPDFKIGLNVTRREMPRVIEDLSTDGGNNFVITNPGEDFSDEAAKQRAEAARLMGTGDPQDAALADALLNRAAQLDAVKDFDKPIRNYNAIALTVMQRPTQRSLLQASYTYSVSKGNYPGLFSTETDQLDPNLTSMYDLPDLMANRYGNMGLDRPHNFKLDGFYQFDLKKAGILNVGGIARVQSGIAHNVLAARRVYGAGESFLLPRGAMARSPVTGQLDLQLGYARRLAKQTVLEGFVRVFNVFDQQDELDVDENYTFDNAHPVVGGDPEDLKHVKALNTQGFESGNVVTPNKNFGNTNARQLPRAVQFGMRLTF